jgi:hypothetical protein
MNLDQYRRGILKKKKKGLQQTVWNINKMLLCMIFHRQIYLVQRLSRNYLSFSLNTCLLQAEVEGRCSILC